MRSDFRPSTVAGTKEAAALRDFDPADVRFGSIASERIATLWRPMSAFAPKADNDGSAAHYLIAACPAPDAATGLRDRAVVQGRGDRSIHRMRRIDKNARLFAFIG